MGKILGDLKLTVLAGIIITLALAFGVEHVGSGAGAPVASAYVLFMVRWLHVLSGVMWIGILWYFNFVQIPTMPKIPDEQKPAIGKYIAPEALFWFRWAALSTIVFGLLLAHLNGYLSAALMLSDVRVLGVAMWMGLFMAANVWFFIWPNQQIALGMKDAEPDAKAAAARKAMLGSRINTMLSIPMLWGMIYAQNPF